MSSRQRSPSPERRSHHSKHPNRDDDEYRDYRDKRHDKNEDKNNDSNDESRPLPHDAPQLSDSDYFLRNTEFRKWLKDEKDRYFDELSGEKARRYFAKFVKAWNRGKLPKSYYSGANSTRTHASEQTSYKWSFASKKSSADDAAIGAARRAVEAATKGEHPDNYIPPRPTSESSKSRAIGPTMPSREDTLLAREVDDERRLSEKAYKRKRDRVEDRERIEDLVGPKESGREGMLEKKRVKRDNDRSYRDAKDDAFGDYDDSTLMGGGDSFQARIAQRDAARRRFEEKKASAREEKVSEVRERQDAMRQKEKATMDMFRQMAKERFG